MKKLLGIALLVLVLGVLLIWRPEPVDSLFDDFLDPIVSRGVKYYEKFSGS